MRGFGSDNHSGVHPLLMKAISAANEEHAPSYGTDEWSARAKNVFKEHFGPKAETHFVFNGTGANVTALRSMILPWQSCLVSSQSHLNVDECGAPDVFAGKLLSLPTSDGRLSLEQLEAALIRQGDQHFAQIRAVSLTQPTELGTCYSLSEISAICDWAHKNQLYVHVDGARLANAVASLKSSFTEMFLKTGVDIVSLGGTKNGLLMGEAVVILNPALQGQFSYIRKQSMQLPSKTRFISAQFETYLGTELWKEIANHSLAMAQLLRKSTSNFPSVKITQATQSNAVFACIPKDWVSKLREKYFFYVWDAASTECRWMTSWDTQPEDISGFTNALSELEKQLPSKDPR